MFSLLFEFGMNVLTLKRRRMLATMMETTLNEAPMTPVTGLCGTYIGGLPDSHLYSDMSCNSETRQSDKIIMTRGKKALNAHKLEMTLCHRQFTHYFGTLTKLIARYTHIQNGGKLTNYIPEKYIPDHVIF